MTVAELIEALRQQPQDARVLVDGYEGGLDDPVVRSVRVFLDVPSGPYEGAHTVARAPDAGVPCVVLSRLDD